MFNAINVLENIVLERINIQMVHNKGNIIVGLGFLKTLQQILKF